MLRPFAETAFASPRAEDRCGAWQIDLKTRAVTWSSELYALLGLSRETYRPQVATQLDPYSPQDRTLLIDRFQRAVNQGEDFDLSLRILRRNDGAARLIRLRGGAEYDAEGRPARLCATVRDITADAPVDDDASLASLSAELHAPLSALVAYARRLDRQARSSPGICAYAHQLLSSAQALQSLLDAPEMPGAIDTRMKARAVPVPRTLTRQSFAPPASVAGVNHAGLRTLLADMRRDLYRAA